MKNICLLIAVLMLMTRCDKGRQEFIISGVLLKDCGGQPMANETLFLWQSNDGGNYRSKELATTSTDKDGKFRISYRTGNLRDNDYLELKIGAGFGFADVMVGIPPGKTIENMIFYYWPVTNFNLNILATKTYNAGDTLFIRDLRVPGKVYLKVAAPLSSGTLYTANGLPLSGMGYPGRAVYRDEQTGTAMIEWYVKTATGNTTKKVMYFAIDKYCSETSEGVVEIK